MVLLALLHYWGAAVAADPKLIIKRLDELKPERLRHEDHWKRCADYTFPLRGEGFNQDKLDAVSGQRKQADILDSTGTDCVQTLASEISSGTTPANALWFELDVGGEEDGGERWLDDAADTIFRHIHSSNFDSERMEAIIDAITFGWLCYYVDEDRERGGLSFEHWPLGQVFLSASKPGAKPDTVYRVFSLTARQMAEEFGEEAVSDEVRKSLKEKPETRFELVWSIYPRRDYKPGSKMAKNMPIASCWVERQTQHLLRESGYHEMPVVVARWERLPNSVYGVGQVFRALPDIKMLQDMWRLDLGAGEIAVAGMWIAEDDGVLNPRAIKVGPRKVIVANSVDSMKPLETGSNFNYSTDRIERLQARIRRTMLADQIPPVDAPTKTATELMIRVENLRKILGPIFGRLQSEELATMVERCFGLAYRAGVLGEPPESIAGQDFSVKYIGPLARSQRLEEVTAVERLAANIGALAQFFPEALDTFDSDEAVKVMGDGMAIPNKVLRSAEQIKAVREAKAQAAQEQQQQAMAQQGAMAMQDAQAKRMATAQ